MSDWEQLHWSGRPQQEVARPPRLRPNPFAKLARFCVRHAWRVVILYAVICVAAGIYAGAVLRLDPGQAVTVALDAQTLAAERALNVNFPGIDDMFVARVTTADPVSARATALAVAASLRQQRDLFSSVEVPGASAYDRTYDLLDLDADVLQQRVRGAEGLQALFSALQAAPDLSGLAALVAQIDRALGQGGSPEGFAPLLDGLAATAEAELAGRPRAMDWVSLAGLAPSENRQWHIVAVPQAGHEAEAGEAARAIAQAAPAITWMLPPGAQAISGDARLQLIAPVLLSSLIALVVLAVGLGRLAALQAVVAGVLATLMLTAGAQAVADQRLDAAEWCFVAAALGPGLLLTLAFVLASEQARSHGIGPAAAAMLAAHRQGPLLCGLTAIAVVFWATWLPRAIPSLSHLAGIAALASVLALLVTLTLLPAVLRLAGGASRATEEHWIDAAAAVRLGPNAGNALNLMVLLIMSAAAFSAVFLAGLRLGEQSALLPAGPDAAALSAVHFVTAGSAPARGIADQLSKLPEVGSFRLIDQLLPEELDRKLASLRELDGYLPPASPTAGPPRPPAATAMPELLASLSRIAASPTAEAPLRAASLRLAKALAAFASASPTALPALEDRLFAGLAEVSAAAARLAHLRAPGIADLDPGLARRFVAEGGAWRIEVLPRPGTGRLTFAAAMRKVSVAAAGRPIVELARNEIMHHEAALAMAMATGAAALLSLLILRDVVGWLVTQISMLLFAGICAAIVAFNGKPADPPVIAAALMALALCLSAAILHVLRLRGERDEADPLPAAYPVFRAGLLPPLVLAACLAPLALSGDAAVARFGLLAGQFQAASLLVSLLVVPQLDEWASALRRA